ncbi:heavy metal translocating P-type ATPase [Granulicatella sp. zg-84]|nr:heavy metal translocating P-type ATPase [Granulicatella sp. zg-84]
MLFFVLSNKKERKNMFDLLKTKEGKLFVAGSISLGIGLLCEQIQLSGSPLWLCLASVLLGYEIVKDVISDIVEEHRLNVDFLMILSACGAISIGYFSEAAILLFIFSGSEMLEDYVYQKSMKTMESLMTHIPKQAMVLKEDDTTEIVDIDQIDIGQTLIVKKGEQIALDGTASKVMLVNESVLTGESIPVYKEIGDDVFAGTINIGDTSVYVATKTSHDSVFSHIVSLVKTANNSKSHLDKRIHQIQKTYVLGVLITVVFFITYLMCIQGLSFTDAFYRGMILLTVASPCALIASMTPAMLSAMSFGAKNGILIKNGNALEKMMRMTTLFSDKTGTLTTGQFRVHQYHLDKPEVLPLVLSMESQSSHPLAKSIMTYFKDVSYPTLPQDIVIQEIAGCGLQMNQLSIGNKRFMRDCTDTNHYLEKESQGTLLFVSENNEVIGYFELVDAVRKDAQEMVEVFKTHLVDVVMLTGDREHAAKSVANTLGLPKFYAECLPEDKVTYMQQYKHDEKVVGMIGDGINDAPILAHADVSIAMGSGTDIAMDVSDVIITQNHLSKIALLYELSQKYGRITRVNIAFAISVILVLILLNMLGILDLTKGVFFHEMSTILVILNGLRLLGFQKK